MESTSQKIIWSIDPLLRTPEKTNKARKLLIALQKLSRVEVRPVSLITPDDLKVPLKIMAPWGEKIKALTEESIQPYLKSLNVKNKAEPHVILSASRKNSIEDLIRFAVKEKTDMILATTHDRKSIEKNRIGHFTNKLIEKSPLPVLTVRPNSKIPTRVSKILFPTDFSKASRKAYADVLQFARRYGAQVIIFHNIYEPVFPAAELTGVMIESYDILKQYAEDFKREQESTSKKWIAEAKEEGVEAEYFSARAEFSLARAILNCAKKKKADMIALGVESHPVRRVVIGSALREVVANSSVPVLVLNKQLK